MYQQKIAKHLIELNKMEFDNTFNTLTMRKKNSEKQFFHFVDKNPMFSDNSKEAIYEYLVSFRKRQFEYKPHIDENYEVPASCLHTDDACKG